MHMSDALITPAVGGTMLAAGVGVMSYAARKIDTEFDEKRIPYMGVAGAFVFASQMINFAIPGTGSSGHIGGGMLLAILLGPHAAFLTMASILLVQALFFADGGLLAYGCNLMNLGFFTCYVAYPLIYKPIAEKLNSQGKMNPRNLYIGALLASVIGLQLGSFGVVLETLLSGRTDLPFHVFVSFMQPIHLAIGIVEGLVTAAVVGYLYKQREDLHYRIFSMHENAPKRQRKGWNAVLRTAVIATVIIGGLFSQFASSSPDGLEWSVDQVSAEEIEGVPVSAIAASFANVQEQVALLPDYDFKEPLGASGGFIGTSTSGIVGSLITLGIAMALGRGFQMVKKRKQLENHS